MKAERAFQAEESTIRLVRRFVGDSLSGDPAVADVVLAASELATNVIRHAETTFTVQISKGVDRIRLEVSDGSSIVPAVEELAGPGRGLRVISGLSDRWGVEASENGKTVWAEFGAGRPTDKEGHSTE